jgi:hypothetical protein
VLYHLSYGPLHQRPTHSAVTIRALNRERTGTYQGG